MKKLFLIAAVALSMSLVACSGGNKGNSTSASSESAQSVEEIKDGNTFEAKSYTVSYPKDWEKTFSTDDILNVKSADKTMMFSINFDAEGPTADQLKEKADFAKKVNTDQYKEVGEPNVISDNFITLRRVTNEGEVELSYTKVFEGTKCIMGAMKSPADKEAEAEKIFMGIINSVKLK
ncbi:MAG: hypothetical protein IKT03_04650 [Muribaculaceae bacterium]|nr:hypothetical protein [Muribaculaceae bacterium]